MTTVGEEGCNLASKLLACDDLRMVDTAEFTGKLQTYVSASSHTATRMGTYVKGLHTVHVHQYADSDDVMMAFLRSAAHNNVEAVFFRGEGWRVCAYLIEYGYSLHRGLDDAQAMMLTTGDDGAL